jgi:tyrosyl-tRNA synthetase
MKNLQEELTWRGMVHDMTPGIAEHFQKGMVKGYIGFDPTAKSLHIGNLATIMLLKHLQLCGHKPYALVGGATGMIGDPSGKSAERSLLDEDTLRTNQEAIRKQLEKFLEFGDASNAAVIVNNYDWFKDISFLQFLREAGKYLTVNYMMAKDSVKKRLETGISFTEFSYQLLQAYDFCYLYQHHGITLQMGGADQWGNITSGTEMIRRKESGEAYALTCPLVTKSDGTKFGKSEQGNVWLDPEMTSPYKFYQFWLNVADADLPRLLRVFTLYTREEINAMEETYAQQPNELKKMLAKEITIRVHGQEEYEKAVAASEILFKKEGVAEALAALEEKVLHEVFEGVPTVVVPKATYHAAPDVLELVSVVTNGEIFPSKGEARKMIQNGGVSINKIKIENPAQSVNFTLLHGQYLLVQKGKKNYYLLKVAE